MDTARGELVEAELDAFINRRARERIRENGRTATAREALWAKSVDCYHQRRRRQNVAAWFAHFCRMAENHARLAESYRERAEQLCCEEGEQ